MHRAAALLSVLLVGSLAGCLTPDDVDDVVDDASQAIFDVLPVEEVWVASSVDGKRIHNAVYRPDTTMPVPVWINFSPYWGDSAEEGGDAFARYLVAEYVPRGYAIVLSSVRGTGHSEGCFQIAGDQELVDTYDVVDYFANAEWSNGNVGAGGKSYDSTTQNGMIAKVPHPDLKTIFHVSGITDMYRYNYRFGVPYTFGTIFNTYYYGQGWHEYGLPLPIGGGAGDPASLDDDDPESLSRLADDLACTEFPSIQANGVGSAAAGAKTDYWIERDWNRFVPASEWNGSVFFVHGLQDWNVKPDHILPWLELLPENIEVSGWLHQWQQDGTGHVYPMRTDWNATMLAWMDYYLKGIGPKPALGLQSQATDDVWRTAPAWPPATAPETVEVAGPPGTRAAYEAVELTRIVGTPNITATVITMDEDPFLTAVMEVNGEWVNEAVLRAIYRNGLEEPEAIAGAPIDVTLEFYPMDLVLAPGDQLTVTIGDGARYALAPTEKAAMAFDMMVGLLNLPIGDPAPDTYQPEPMECFTC